MKTLNPQHGFGTLANHAAETGHPLHAHVAPIFQTTAFSAADTDALTAVFRGERRAYYYSRSGNPNTDQTAQKIAFLEGAGLWRATPTQDPADLFAGLLFASGMAAITAALLALLRAGDLILAQNALYGGTHHLLEHVLPRFGIRAAFVEDATPDGWRAAFAHHPQARLAFAETPTNPTLQLVDLPALARLAHEHDAWLIVDNTFATPYCQRPLELGADAVVYSTTKFLSGHATVTGGAVVSRHPDFIAGPLKTLQNSLGAVPSPFDAWLTHLSLKTFEIRMQRHCANAQAVAEFLASHPKVERVHYPGLRTYPDHALAAGQMSAFGGMLSFEVPGGYASVRKVIDALQLITLIPSLGSLDTTVSHPATMSHHVLPADVRARMGVTDGLIRMSVGIENVEDLLADLDQALAAL